MSKIPSLLAVSDWWGSSLWYRGLQHVYTSVCLGPLTSLSSIMRYQRLNLYIPYFSPAYHFRFPLLCWAAATLSAVNGLAVRNKCWGLRATQWPQWKIANIHAWRRSKWRGPFQPHCLGLLLPSAEQCSPNNIKDQMFGRELCRGISCQQACWTRRKRGNRYIQVIFLGLILYLLLKLCST